MKTARGPGEATPSSAAASRKACPFATCRPAHLTGAVAHRDLRRTLEEVGRRLLKCYCDDRSWALRRLLAAEINQFPDCSTSSRAAQRTASSKPWPTVSPGSRLPAGLQITDPMVAAELFSALLSGPMDKRARLGTRKVPDAELRAVASAAVQTFLRAFAAEHGRNASSAPSPSRGRARSAPVPTTHPAAQAFHAPRAAASVT
jgi:hypothetical protein